MADPFKELRPVGTEVSFEDVIARVERLESQKLGLRDLPITDLQNRLEQEWQPDGAVLLQPGTVGPESLAQVYLKTAVLGDTIVQGIVACTYPSTPNTGSGQFAVALPLGGATPKRVLCTITAGGSLQFGFALNSVYGYAPNGCSASVINLTGATQAGSMNIAFIGVY